MADERASNNAEDYFFINLRKKHDLMHSYKIAFIKCRYKAGVNFGRGSLVGPK